MKNLHFKRRTGRRRAAYTAALLLLLLLVSSAPARAQVVKLERGWQFHADREGTLRIEGLGKVSNWRDVRVGLSWNAQFEDMRDYMGAAWYRTSFENTERKTGGRVLLRFGAVDYFSEVFVNGRKIGAHEGGYTPFAFDITDALKPGANELIVRVVDPPMDEKEGRARFPEMMYNEIPHGKQNWYVQTGGIWQPVTLEVKPAEHITNVQVISKTDGRLQVYVYSNASLGPPPVPRSNSPASPRPQTILERTSVSVVDPSGKTLALKLTGGGGYAENDFLAFEGRVPEPRLWSTDSPNLYTVEVALGDDHRTERFGFRSFEARDGKFYLNGEPFYMIGALDQDFYPETIYTAPSEEYVRDEMLKAKRLGLNLLRCHIKVCEPVYLKVADEVGMLVWYEIPSWNDFNYWTPKAAARGERVFAEMVERDWNHPSIVVHSIINESWGADLKQAEQRKWLLAAFDRAKRMTSPLGRLVVDNSMCCENFHLKTDIEDNHKYNSIPDEHENFDAWVGQFAARQKRYFSEHGDAQRTGREPLVLSEFGNWGLPRLPEKLPWWFARDFGGREVTRPAGVFERFRAYKFDTLFADYNSLAEATQWHQFVSLKHEIEEIRRHAPLQGYVITEFTDINWEVNGLLDMWRNPKVYASELAKIQQPDVVFARTNKRNYTSGEKIQFEVMLSHYGGRDLDGATVAFRAEAGKRIGMWNADAPTPRASVATLARPALTAPEVVRPTRQRTRIEVRDRAGNLVAENMAEVFIYPRRSRDEATPRVIHVAAGGDAKLARALSAAGYNVSDKATPDAKVLVVAAKLDDFVEAHLHRGGRALLLLDAKDSVPASANFKVAARAGSDLDGNWVTNFNWARIDAPPFGEVGFTKILGFEASRVVPRHIIQGVAAGDYGDVLSGIFYGWLNNNAALAVQLKAGAGKFLATTFRFDEYGADPYATRLLDAMISYAGGANFEPKMIYTRRAATTEATATAATATATTAAAQPRPRVAPSVRSVGGPTN
jgi:hypothetical protein